MRGAREQRLEGIRGAPDGEGLQRLAAGLHQHDHPARYSPVTRAPRMARVATMSAAKSPCSMPCTVPATTGAPTTTSVISRMSREGPGADSPYPATYPPASPSKASVGNGQ